MFKVAIMGYNFMIIKCFKSKTYLLYFIKLNFNFLLNYLNISYIELVNY